jgi:hypothetical protein
VTDPASTRVLEKCGFIRIDRSEQHFPARGQTFPVQQFRIERGQQNAPLTSDFSPKVATAARQVHPSNRPPPRPAVISATGHNLTS